MAIQTGSKTIQIDYLKTIGIVNTIKSFVHSDKFQWCRTKWVGVTSIKLM